MAELHCGCVVETLYLNRYEENVAALREAMEAQATALAAATSRAERAEAERDELRAQLEIVRQGFHAATCADYPECDDEAHGTDFGRAVAVADEQRRAACDERDDARNERERAEAAIQRVRELHRQVVDSSWPEPGHCLECVDAGGDAMDYRPYPCSTIAALDSSGTVEDAPDWRQEAAEAITLALCAAWPVEIGSDLVFAEQVGHEAAAALFKVAPVASPSAGGGTSG